MKLFSEEPYNLLNPNSEPHKTQTGEAIYYGEIFPSQLATKYYHNLLENIPWQPDTALIWNRKQKEEFNKRLITTKRKIAWYGDKEYTYTYSGHTKTASLWDRENKEGKALLFLKKQVEEKTGEIFNSCLLNFYNDGGEGMAWHADGEKDLKKHGVIASLSLGAERKFCFKRKNQRNKNNPVISKILEHGSLLVMKGRIQSHWLHRLPTTKLVTTGRINLTFRYIDK